MISYYICLLKTVGSSIPVKLQKYQAENNDWKKIFHPSLWIFLVELENVSQKF